MKTTNLLKKALLFRDTMPTYSSIKSFYEVAIEYQEVIGSPFMSAKSGQATKILNWEGFFEFLSDKVKNKTFTSFEDIDTYLEVPKSRADAIERRGDSKSSYVKVFDKTLLAQYDNKPAQLFTKENIDELQDFDRVVAIENAETFLTIAKYHLFDCHNFLYLGGHSNTLTRKFLKDKTVLFFIDFDIISMNIYEDFECKHKSLFVPEDIESYFSNYPNERLYQKQRKLLREVYEGDALKIITLIKKYSTVVEQEIIR